MSRGRSIINKQALLDEIESEEVKPWYLSGGVSLSDILVAYQAKGAISYEASKLNLANSSLYPLIDSGKFTGHVAPAWNSGGWTFVNNSKAILFCGASVTFSCSLFIKGVYPTSCVNTIFNSTNASAMGTGFIVVPDYSGTYGEIAANIGTGNVWTSVDSMHSGTLCISGIGIYVNGSYVKDLHPFDNGIINRPEDTILDWTGIGGMCLPAYNFGKSGGGTIEAVAYYKRPMTVQEISAISTAMNLL